MKSGNRLEIEFLNGDKKIVIADGFGTDGLSWKGQEGYDDRILYKDCKSVRDLDEKFTMYYKGKHYYKDISSGYQSIYDDEYPSW